MLLVESYYDYIIMDFSAMFFPLDDSLIRTLKNSKKTIASRTFASQCRHMNECVSYRLNENYERNISRINIDHGIQSVSSKVVDDTFGLAKDMHEEYRLLVIEANQSLEEKLLFSDIHTDILCLVDNKLLRYGKGDYVKLKSSKRLIKTKTHLKHYRVNTGGAVYTANGAITLGIEIKGDADSKTYLAENNNDLLVRLFNDERAGISALTEERLHNIRSLCEKNARWDLYWLTLPVEVVYADPSLKNAVGYTMKNPSKVKLFSRISLFDSRSVKDKLSENRNITVGDVLSYCLKLTARIQFLAINDIYVPEFIDNNIALSKGAGNNIIMVDPDGYCTEGYTGEHLALNGPLSREYAYRTKLDLIHICEESLSAFVFSLLCLDVSIRPMNKSEFRFSRNMLKKSDIEEYKAKWNSIPANLQKFFTELFEKNHDMSVDLLIYELEQAKNSSFASEKYKDIFKSCLTSKETVPPTPEIISIPISVPVFRQKILLPHPVPSPVRKTVMWIAIILVIAAIVKLSINNISDDSAKSKQPNNNASQINETVSADDLHRFDTEYGYYLCASEDLNGYGEFYYNEGGTYKGDLVDGTFEGTGTFIWENGDTYTGTYKNGSRTGTGTYTWANGDIYTGDFIDGVMTGTGTYTWLDGDIYTGDYVDGNRTGHGEYHWSEGDYYIGDFIDGERSGTGTYYWTDGTSYSGVFDKGIRTGDGKLYDKENRLIYSGGFDSGLFDGKGIYYFPNGASFETEWAGGTFENEKEVNLVYNSTEEPAAKGHWSKNIFYGSYYQNDQWHDIP